MVADDPIEGALPHSHIVERAVKNAIGETAVFPVLQKRSTSTASGRILLVSLATSTLSR